MLESESSLVSTGVSTGSIWGHNEYSYYPYHPYPHSHYHYYPYGESVKIDSEQFEELVNRLAVLAGEPDPEKEKLQEKVKELEKQLAAVRKAIK